MSRWLVASVIALLLSCLGFTAAAQGASTVQAQPCHLVHVHDAAPGDELNDPAGTHAETGVDFAEAVPAGHAIFAPEHLSQATPARAVVTPPSPPLDRPRRPPRGSIFAA